MNDLDCLKQAKSGGYQQWRIQTERCLFGIIGQNNQFNDLEEALQKGVQARITELQRKEAQDNGAAEEACAQLERIREIGIRQEKAFRALLTCLENIRDKGTELLDIVA